MTAPARHSFRPASLDLGVIGNCAIAALVDGTARLVWMCLPRPDADPVFFSLLGGSRAAEAGHWSFELTDPHSAGQAYRRNTAVLETVLTDIGGNCLRISDFAPRFMDHGRSFRPMTIVRLVEPIAGIPRMTVRLRPGHGYGAHTAKLTRGSNHARFAVGDLAVRLTTDASIDYIVNETPFIVDRPYAFLLGVDEPLADAPLRTARSFLNATEDYWRNWTRSLSLPFEWQEAVVRAAITLKLCSYEDTGAIMAALTTSIPEFGPGGRNWDYRFCWLRDAYFTVRALNSLGATATMEGYLRYVGNIVAGSAAGYLQPLYGICREPALDEHIADALLGYRGLGPVRRGNAAFRQVQNDSYGSVILAIAQTFFDHRLPEVGDEALFLRLEPLGRQAVARWMRPDAGLWEYRTRTSVHTHSAMMCWAAADRLARIAARLGLAERSQSWRKEADSIHRSVLAGAWNQQRGHFVSSLGGEEVDASLLLMTEIGFLPPTDPRFIATLAAVERDLKVGGHLYRYRTPDDFGPPDSAFTACTFWLVGALARVGRSDDAREMFGELLARRNPLGLLSEGLAVESNELWGNFPQTYSMVGLIKSATLLSRPWEDAF